MKALSIKQPWAWLIVNGYKPLENRSWKTKFRGEFAIHASLKFDEEGYHWVEEHAEELGVDMSEFPLPNEFVRGAILGKATITGCVDKSDSPWFFGPYGFKLKYATAFVEPIPCKGKLGFWDYPNIIAEPEEVDGELFCHCQLPVKEVNQVMPFFDGRHRCRYCDGIWYK